MFRQLEEDYRSVTSMVLSSSISTSILYDKLISVSPLHRAFPTLFSHCLAPDITIVVAFTVGI